MTKKDETATTTSTTTKKQPTTKKPATKKATTAKKNTTTTKQDTATQSQHKKFAKLTEAQKIEVIGTFLTCGNYRETGRLLNVSYKTVQKTVENNPDLVAKLKAEYLKNAEVSVLSYMKDQQARACTLIDFFMEAMLKKDKVDKANLRDISVALGIVVDKFMMLNGTTSNTEAEHSELMKLLENMNTKLPGSSGGTDTEEALNDAVENNFEKSEVSHGTEAVNSNEDE